MLRGHDFGPFLCRDTIMILFFSEKTVSELSQNKVQIFFSSFFSTNYIISNFFCSRLVMDPLGTGLACHFLTLLGRG